ncbi:PREDICTED: putative uncharacterized protein B3GALT5-AS1 [Colobus angolensis palliatus]|uniref:putative uncharacterized protein B3GALT5-AS1 n=1 Tax=Colobus angolensis palliatus TaxID=336983 RepID=UPI0005F58815|nr:PREDICTED: putative uncharacterized protein B3GALT5-AS1 [Colobus angolensis palliatus]
MRRLRHTEVRGPVLGHTATGGPQNRTSGCTSAPQQRPPPGTQGMLEQYLNNSTQHAALRGLLSFCLHATHLICGRGPDVICFYVRELRMVLP